MILITGGTGVMGRALTAGSVRAGRSVRVLTLPGDPNAVRARALGADVRFGDISKQDDVRSVCDGVTTVYHLAAIIIAYDNRRYRSVNVDGTKHMIAEARRAGVEHFVYVSSASVVYPKPTPYSLSKRACEDIVRGSGLEYTIVRPTLVYGKQGGREFDLFLDYLKRFPVVPFIGAGRARKRPVFVDDVTDGLLKLAGNGAARGKQYNFSGGEVISMREFARLCLTLAGDGARPIVPLPVWFCRALAGVMGAVMKRPPLRWPVIAGVTQDADLDPGPAKQDLGYAPAGVREKLPSCFPRGSAAA
ncbi:MAG: NAD-dependent epimerase/dehydratase family protein [Chitinivibrionales bacterium]|nr:NAD-dependent epimerase/dehydratase family protein [Chitinivibrionales bacterium]MBD3396526.1 NAD-dependent epimerase/dehydratase family protein [Chitinivibrionales bacterium]